jgi:hypothetical protein
MGGWQLDAINFWGIRDPWLQSENGMQLRPDLVGRLAQGKRVMSSIGGGAHTVLGMVEQQRPFDFVLPSLPDLPIDANREIVPADAVRATLLEMTAPYLEQLAVVAGSTAGRPVTQLEPPPPLAEAERIAPHVPWSLFPGQPRLIAPKWFRYKLWRMHNEVIEKACARMGIGYVPAPNSANDAEGFLHPRYEEDGVHANAAYGALVLEEFGRKA